MTDTECILVCAKNGPQYRIERVPAGQEGSYVHQPIRLSDDASVERAKECTVCGGALTREENVSGSS